MFAYAWHPPSPAKYLDRKSELWIRVFKHQFENISNAEKALISLKEKASKKSKSINIDFLSGNNINENNESFIIYDYYDGQKKIGSWFGCAFKYPDGVIEAGSSVMTEKFHYQVRLLINEEHYNKFSHELFKSLKTISFEDALKSKKKKSLTIKPRNKSLHSDIFSSFNDKIITEKMA